MRRAGDAAARERAEAVVRNWDAVPLADGHRPWVLLESVRRSGFTSSAAKTAAFHGRIEPAPGVTVPTEVLTALSPGFRPDGPPAADDRVLVVGARPGPATFRTDRGPARFPAWHLDLQDGLGSDVVLDPALERHRVPGLPADVAVLSDPAAGTADGPPAPDLTALDLTAPDAGAPPDDLGESARLAADGRTLTVRFLGSPEAFADYPCGYAVEGRVAVAVIPIEAPRPPTGPEGPRPTPVPIRDLPWRRQPRLAAQWFVKYTVLRRRPIVVRPLLAQLREVTVVLAEPLGDRVVVEPELGRPLRVVREAAAG